MQREPTHNIALVYLCSLPYKCKLQINSKLYLLLELTSGKNKGIQDVSIIIPRSGTYFGGSSTYIDEQYLFGLE